MLVVRIHHVRIIMINWFFSMHIFLMSVLYQQLEKRLGVRFSIGVNSTCS